MEPPPRERASRARASAGRVPAVRAWPGDVHRERSVLRVLVGFALLAVGASAWADSAGELLYAAEGNRLWRFDVDTIRARPVLGEIFIEQAQDSEEPGGPGFDFSIRNRDINGMLCPFPDGSGRFVAGEDSGQPSPPAGWGVFAPDGTQIGKLTPTYVVDLPGVPDNPEPFGCAFDPDSGLLFTTSVGEQGFGASSGQLIVWFPPFDHFPGPAGGPGTYPNNDELSTNFCKLAVDLSTAGGVAVDRSGRVYVSSTSGLRIDRFSPPFPASVDDCTGIDPLGSPLAENVNREVFARGDTYTGLALAPNGNLYAASVLNERIREFGTEGDRDGEIVRTLLEAPEDGSFDPGSPQGIAVGGDGTVYYADLDLVGTLPNVGPGPNGKVRAVHFDESGDPLPPVIVMQDLAFPDGVGVLPGNLQAEWRTYAGGPRRLFYNPDETIITPENVGDLAIRWSFRTGAVVTGSPSVALVDVPGEGRIQVVYFGSWDGNLYAVRLADGTELWRVEADLQPGASFPNAGSAHVETLEGRDRVFLGAGEKMYSVDAATGEVLWVFTAGTGCEPAPGEPTGLCGFRREQNQIESSPYVAGGRVFFGMDVDDDPVGKGGFFALDALDGTLAWFFDLESGRTCRPFPEDEIRRFDGYHDAAALGLPPDFLLPEVQGGRPGCDFPRTPNGCGNVWSSPAVDTERELLYFASSNCDTDDDPESNEPLPPMPPYDEAVVALDFDGFPAWRWRPREVDNDDLAFGAVPNLFTIDFEGAPREVVGIGNKDGTYYVLDRDGVNEVNGAIGNDPDLPYWSTNVVPGGAFGGILATAAADEDLRRIYFGTAPGDSFAEVGDPQRPTVHALDMDTGAIAWDDGQTGVDASFSPTSAVPGLAFIGRVTSPRLRAYRTSGDDGSLVHQTGSLHPNTPAISSGAVAVNGVLLVGTGIGFRGPNPSSPGDIVSRIASDVVALCVSGTGGCAACDDGFDNDADGLVDALDPGCRGRGDPSEVAGDLDYDFDVDESDRGRMVAAFGSSLRDPHFDPWADLDGDGAVTWVDYQTWIAMYRDFHDPQPACGLLGVEPVLALGLARLAARRRRPRVLHSEPSAGPRVPSDRMHQP